MRVRNFLTAFLVCFGFLGCASLRSSPWATFKTPTAGDAHSIGSYAAGCIAGAVPLDAPQGPGYLLMRMSRGRFYGHPALIRFLRDFSLNYYEKKNRLLLLGDLGQPRGGPMPKAHKSHQTGLDVDIWLTTLADKGNGLTVEEREAMNAPLVANYAKDVLDKRYWNAETSELLQAMAKRPEVERVFVNPIIKRELCLEKVQAGRGLKKKRGLVQGSAQEFTPEFSWLAKIRPWWGHDRHFHVRLYCTPGDAQCVAQSPVAADVKSVDGCDETLNWWFSEEAKLEAEKMSKMAESGEGERPPKLPAACEAVEEAQ